MRTPLIAGNWKMNQTLVSMREWVAQVRRGLEAFSQHGAAPEVAVFPPAHLLFPIAKALDGSALTFGAQNLYHEQSGAYTGEISAAMIAECGAKYVILGHSERRHTIGHLEDDWMINRKCKASQVAGVTPILCVGETLAQRDAGLTLEVLTFQVVAGVVGLKLATPTDLVVAYEPVWAIGTGRNATAGQAQEAHAHIRAELRRSAGTIADRVRILYGGSMKPENARELLSQPDVDGGLVGGASLKSETFLGIVDAALAARS